MNFRVTLLGWFGLGCLLAVPKSVWAQSTADLLRQDEALTQQLDANAAQTTALENKLDGTSAPATGWIAHLNPLAAAPVPTHDANLENQITDLKTKYNDLFEKRSEIRGQIRQLSISGIPAPPSPGAPGTLPDAISSPVAGTAAPAIDWAKEPLPQAKEDSSGIETALVNEPPGSLVPLPKPIPAAVDATPPSEINSTATIPAEGEPQVSPAAAYVPPPVARVVPGLDDPTTDAKVKAQKPEVDAVINGTSSDSPAPAVVTAEAPTPPTANDPNQPVAQASSGVDWVPILVGVAAIGAGAAAIAATSGGSSAPTSSGSYVPMRSGPVYCH